MTAFEMVVGVEVHVQLRTRTKIFCRCSTSFGDPPNTNVCPVCLGLPGALPVLNAHAVDLAVRTALVLGCTVHERSVFARKNYFYPDLPRGYQISQFDQPLATRGRAFGVGIARIHMEEDAGKSLHDRFAGVTVVDLNRAGVPLVEIVTDPDLRSAADTGAFLRSLRQLLEYAQVSDVNMEQGSLRVDANISIRPAGDPRLGTRTELKNLNSFSAVERALDIEFARQRSRLVAGRAVEQETMLWDDVAGQVRPSRVKEGSEDYRYFPDPDLPPLVVTRDRITRIRERTPELPDARRERFRAEYSLSDYDMDVLTSSPALADYYEGVARRHGDAKASANWVMGELLAALRSSGSGIEHFRVRPDDLARLLDMVRDGVVTHTAAKQVFAAMVESGGAPEDVARDRGLVRVSDDAALGAWLDQAIAEHPEEAARYAAGERRLQGVLIGAAMRKSGGSADPRRLAQLLGTRFGT